MIPGAERSTQSDTKSPMHDSACGRSAPTNRSSICCPRDLKTAVAAAELSLGHLWAFHECLDSNMNSPLREYPALRPPPGVMSNFVNPPSYEQTLTVMEGVLVPLMLLAVLVRLYVRAKITRTWGWDDCECISTGRRANRWLNGSRYVYRCRCMSSLESFRLDSWIFSSTLHSAHLWHTLSCIHKVRPFRLHLGNFPDRKQCSGLDSDGIFGIFE